MKKMDVCQNCRCSSPSIDDAKPCAECVADGRGVETRAD